MIGTLLEFVHGSWRIALIYTMGVITGALFSMPLSPFNFLVGASGGDYALIAACIANLVLNWDSMDSLLAKYGRLSLIVCWAVMDIGLLVHRNITQKASFRHDFFYCRMPNFMLNFYKANFDLVASSLWRCTSWRLLR